MAFEMDANGAFSFGTALLLTAFALTVGWIGKFRGTPLWFAMFEGGFGVAMALSNLQQAFQAGTPWEEAPIWVFLVFNPPRWIMFGFAFTGLWLIANRFPVPITQRDRRRRPWTLLAPLALVGVVFARYLARIPELPPATSWVAIVAVTLDNALFYALCGLMWATVILLAWRHGSSASAQAQGQMALVAAAVCIYPAMYVTWVGMPFAIAGDFPGATLFVVNVLLVFVAAAVWLLHTTGAGGTSARNVVFVVLTSALVGVVASARSADESPSGVARILAILVLAFAILRHRILGIDVKVRFAISKSTVAAVFIAVFFIASEGAQILFGRQNELVGLVAAGALVFAMAPLQRVADRFAAKAVPPSSPTGPVSRPSPNLAAMHEAYREAVWAALADGKMTDKEEEHLAGVAHALALSPLDALRIRRAVEKEAFV